MTRFLSELACIGLHWPALACIGLIFAEAFALIVMVS